MRRGFWWAALLWTAAAYALYGWAVSGTAPFLRLRRALAVEWRTAAGPPMVNSHA